MELQLKVEGAFNYDPIDYDPTGGETTLPANKLHNGYFTDNIGYWARVAGAWIRVATGDSRPTAAFVLI